MNFKNALESTRFFYIQEGLAIGVVGAFAKVFLPTFPVLELYGFVGPMVAIAFGLKQWGEVKEQENKSLEVRSKNGAANGMVPGDKEIPIR
jgi:xanthosine utilization system XapX-like protein